MKKTSYGIPLSQIEEINNLLLAYSDGKYETKGKISKHRDEIDTIISGVNMLGEELSATTISRDYFSKIYNSVGEMLFVLNEAGDIMDANSTAQNKLGIASMALGSVNITSFFGKNESSLASIIDQLNKSGHYSAECVFLPAESLTEIPVNCNYAHIKDSSESESKYLLVATDITERKQTERLILKTIVETQENEQRRVAEDLHDSLGQELSTVKLLLSSISSRELKEQELLVHCKGLLDSSIVSLRNTCFNMMPSSLKRYGIAEAVKQLIHKIKFQEKMKFHFKTSENLVIANKGIQVALYRIIQEFVNNSIKHAECDNVNISIAQDFEKIYLRINDDGKGFDYTSKYASNGLNNMESRVKAYNGVIEMKSEIGKGTSLEVSFLLD
ncbi:MAG: PAS domain S-box protein [Flavobacteriales bacterium]|nr:PAS domain S-box protein [Flavobacteriales bacterium]